MGIFDNPAPTLPMGNEDDDADDPMCKVQGILASLATRRKPASDPLAGKGGESKTTPVKRDASDDELAHPAGKNFIGFDLDK